MPIGTAFYFLREVYLIVKEDRNKLAAQSFYMLEAEKQYIKEAQAGNKESFAQLYRHYLPQIFRFVYLKVNNKAEAEDLTHEVFLNTWQNLKTYTHREFPFSSWLYRIARNEVIDFYRTNKKEVRLELVEEDFIKIPETESLNLDQSLELEKIKKLFQHLTQEQQDVLIMRFIEDLSPKEVSAALNKSEGAVRIIQHRGLNELKKLIYKNDGNNNPNIKEA